VLDVRIREFRRLVEDRCAERSIPTRHGVARLDGTLPDVYDANYLSVEGAAATASVLAAEAESALEAHHHRRIVVEGGDAGLADDFAVLGYTLSTHLVLAHRREPDRRVDTTAVREASLAELLPVRTASTLREPWGNESIARQLNDAKRRLEAVVPTRFFAATVSGRIAGYCELREIGGVAQIEDVEVLEEHRGRGLGRALVQHALDEARRGNDVVWLEALADDWPRELYARLGFDVVDRSDVYTLQPSPLTGMRLRTPRLELRLGTAAELRELYRVAAAGIHDPAEMPFAVPWTDSLAEDSFLAFHRECLADWRPDAWSLNLVAFHDGRPIGSQGIEGGSVTSSRTVSTGSWLGRAWQGRGLGTEMRAAVLCLAFAHLGAETARSGAVDGNAQSLGVSRRLGYEVVGSHTIAPRGDPVEHTDLELRRERFSSPVAVAVGGFDGLRPLFG
jgi:RimJ/RimL family protein N-acetyltransferase/ribosomal protein S18 acetylase RimI-like enzyme